jgi:hypothetical protein
MAVSGLQKKLPSSLAGQFCGIAFASHERMRYRLM